jgi:putative transport protein
MDALNRLFRDAPEAALFLSIAIGYLIGRIKIGFFQLGSVAGTLLAAVVVGQADVDVSPHVKAVCFALFIFAVGYKSGPQFFSSLNASSAKPILLAVVVCVTALLGVVLASKVFRLDPGTAAGVMAGSCTESAAIGTAGDAIGRLPIAADLQKTYQNNIAVGYAMTYLFGTLGVILFIRSLAPRLLGVNLRAAGKEYEEKHGGGGPDEKGRTVPYVPIGLRAFRVSSDAAAAGKPVGAVVKQLGEGAAIGRIRRRGRDIQVSEDVVLKEGDRVGLSGARDVLGKATEVVGPEVGDPAILGDAVEVADAVLTRKEFAGRTLGEIAEQIGDEQRYGVYLQRIERQGRTLPRLWTTRVERGDVLRLVGWRDRLGGVVRELGYEERPTDKTDLVYLALGITLGTALGLLTLTIAGVPLTLGTGGGVLVAGLVLGWLRSRQRRFGAFPAAAQSVFADFGLAAFVGVVGLTAGPKMIDSIRENGPGLVLIGLAVALLPQIVGLLFGRLVLRLHPLILLGGLAGSQTVTAALNAVLEESESSAPVVGYTVTYGIGNVLLTLWGPVLIAILA